MKFYNLQALRAIAALLVVLVHMKDAEQKLGGATILGDWTAFGVVGVDLFFVLSGFVMVFTTESKAGGASDALSFFYSRVTRIYPIWWLTLTALVIFWMVKPDLVYSGNYTDPNFVKDYLLIIGDQAPLLAVGWTLIHEMYFYFVFMLILLLPYGPRFRLYCILAWAGLVMLGSAVLAPKEPNIVSLAFNPLTLEFIIGALIAYAWRFTQGRFGWSALSIGLIWGALSCYAYVLAPIDERVSIIGHADEAIRVLLFGAPCGLIVYGAVAVEARKSISADNPLVAIGDWSYSLYLTHMLTLNAGAIMLRKFSNESLYDNFLILPILVAVCIIVSAICYKFFEQPTTRLFKKLYTRFRLENDFRILQSYR